MVLPRNAVGTKVAAVEAAPTISNGGTNGRTDWDKKRKEKKRRKKKT